MKSNKSVIWVWLLMCCIPAVTYFALKDQASERGDPTLSSAPPASVWPIEKQTLDYQVSLEPVNTPLKMGKQELNLEIQSRTPLAKMPVVKIVMPMGKMTMTAPMTLKKLVDKGQYQIQTEFTMAGDWEIHVKPQPTAEMIPLNFQVQP